MTNQSAVNATISPDELRARIVAELSLEGLSRQRQDEIMTQVSEALLDRINLALWKRLPPDELVRMAELAKDKDENDPEAGVEFMQACAKHIPNLKEVIDGAISSGLQTFHALITETANKS